MAYKIKLKTKEEKNAYYYGFLEGIDTARTNRRNRRFEKIQNEKYP